MKRNILKTFCYAVVATFAASCDVVEDDQLPLVSRQIDMHVAPNKSAVIDVRAIIPDVTSINGTGNPFASVFNNRYVHYDLKGKGTDRFTFEAKSPTFRTETEVRISPLSNETECGDTGSFTYAKISNKSALVVNLFNNSEFCDFDPTERGNGLSISHGLPGEVDENTDGLLLAICACGGSSAILTYVPPPGFVGQVKFKYRLGVSSGASSSPPNISNPAGFRFYSAHDAVIDVVAE